MSTKNGIQEVSGSIPLISTRLALKTIGFQGFFLFCGTLCLIWAEYVMNLDINAKNTGNCIQCFLH